MATTTMSMATKLVRAVTYHERLPPLKSYDPLNTWSWEIIWQTKSIISLIRATKLGRMLTYLKRLPHIKLLNTLFTWLTRSRDKLKPIFPLPLSMGTILGRMVTYLEGFPLIKSHDALITWSCEIMWHTKKTKTIIHPPDSLWPLNLAGWWYT